MILSDTVIIGVHVKVPSELALSSASMKRSHLLSDCSEEQHLISSSWTSEELINQAPSPTLPHRDPEKTSTQTAQPVNIDKPSLLLALTRNIASQPPAFSKEIVNEIMGQKIDGPSPNFS